MASPHSIFDWIPGFKRRDPSVPRDAVERERHWFGIVLFSVVFALCRTVAKRVCKKLQAHNALEAWAIAEVARKHRCAAEGVAFVPSLTPEETKREAQRQKKAA